MGSPQLWVFAGPNGAGKSTLVDRHAAGRLPVINPDNIARELPRAPSGGPDERAAGERAIAERASRLAARDTFGFETTLSGNSELRLMREAASAGYKVNLVFVGVRDPETSAARVGERVASGGHDVPREHTDRRYARTMANLPVAMGIADRSIVLDNSGERHRLLLVRENGRTRFVADVMPGWAARAIPADLREQRQGEGLIAMARALRGSGPDLLDWRLPDRPGRTNDPGPALDPLARKGRSR